MAIDIPTRFTAGDTFELTVSHAAYPASEYVGLLYLTSEQQRISLTAAASGTDFVFSATPATTAAWPPGEYYCSVVVTQGSTLTKTLATQWLDVLPDPIQGMPSRSFARTLLSAIEATLIGRATQGQLDIIQQQTGIHAASAEPGALIKLRDKYKAEVAREVAADRLAAGLGADTGTIRVRL